MVEARCEYSGCDRGLVGVDLCPRCNGSGEDTPAPERKAKALAWTAERVREAVGLHKAGVFQESATLAGDVADARVAPPPSTGWADAMRKAADVERDRNEERKRASAAIDATKEAAPKMPPAKAVPVADRAHVESASTAGDRARAEAAALGVGRAGQLRWVESKGAAFPGLHPLDPQWFWHFDEFYASGKFLDVGRWGVRAAKSDSCCCALVSEVLLTPRELTVVGVCPILSSNMREAGDRFDTVKKYLRAIGLNEVQRIEPDAGSFKSSGGGNSALVIELKDFDGHDCEFRIYAATERGVAGCTAISGLGDELDLWGEATGKNPADKVVEMFVSRFTTQPNAKLHLMSATYDRKSYHASMIESGDTPRQRVARLGARGAAKDTADRRALAARIKSTDPLLLAASDSRSTDIPCWVSNPKAPIDDCYSKMDGNLPRMFAKYGGRPEFAGDESPLTLEDAEWMAEQNRELSRPLDDRQRSADGLFDYGPSATPGRYRGL